MLPRSRSARRPPTAATTVEGGGQAGQLALLQRQRGPADAGRLAGDVDAGDGAALVGVDDGDQGVVDVHPGVGADRGDELERRA